MMKIYADKLLSHFLCFAGGGDKAMIPRLILMIHHWARHNSKDNKTFYHKEGHWWCRISVSHIVQQIIEDTSGNEKTLFSKIETAVKRALLKIASDVENNYLIRAKLNQDCDDQTYWYRVNYNHLEYKCPQAIKSENDQENKDLCHNVSLTSPQCNVTLPQCQSDTMLLTKTIKDTISPFSSPKGAKRKKTKSVKVTAKESIKIPITELKQEDVMIDIAESDCHPTNHTKLFDRFVAYKHKKEAASKTLKDWQNAIKRYCKNGNETLDMHWNEPAMVHPEHSSAILDAQATRQQIENENKEYAI